MKYAQHPKRDCPVGRVGFEIDVLVIDLNPLPRSRIGLPMRFQGEFGDFFIFYEAIRYYRCNRQKANLNSVEAKSENNEGFGPQTLFGGFLLILENGPRGMPGQNKALSHPKRNRAKKM